MALELIDIVCEEFSLKRNFADNIVNFYNEKATIPFVSRYRKDQTGNLDEVEIAKIYDGIKYFKELIDRKTFILEEIERKGKLTDELARKIKECLDSKKLEDLYLPYKEKKKTKAEKAREAGILPLADMLLSDGDQGDPEDRAKGCINAEKGYVSVEKVLEGALYIIAQKVIESVDLMESFLKGAFTEGMLTSGMKKKYEGGDSRFEDYYHYSEKLSNLKLERNSHRFLAIQRGVSIGALSIKIELPDEINIFRIEEHFIRKDHFYKEYLKRAVDIAYNQYLRPALDTRIIGELSEIAEGEAIRVFAKNLESLLMASPIPYANVIGLDPGLRTGIKTAVLDRDGTFLENMVLYIGSPREIENSGKILLSLITKYKIEAISIGNGTGSRETLSFVRNLLKEKMQKIIVAVVNESGASVYSASEIAREEFPELDVTVRGAISIGRRLQNPLAELVKIDPKSIGVGQYQHDVNEKKLKEALDRVIEFCVNSVGVDVNTASYAILTHISGLSEKNAKGIVEYRKKNGFFKRRQELMKIKGIGEKVFEQCAGFLMIHNGENPLDRTRVHPESYSIVQDMADNLREPISRIIGNVAILKGIDSSKYLTGTCEIHNFNSILNDLAHPGQDPRREFRNITYKEGVETLEDLKENMILEGRVTNVTNFGAFVDLGVHQDGLCHKSRLCDRYVSDPGDVVSVGDIVKVQILSVDYIKRRISLKLLSGNSLKQAH